MTAAAFGQIGKLRRDPMAMLPFCGYNMAKYWQHWLNIGEKKGAQLPNIYYVNWFRKDENGKFMWPGFGDNSRVLKWVFERCAGTAEAVETPIGNIPTSESIDFSGLDIDDAAKAKLLEVEVDGWLQEIPLISEYYDKFGDLVPDVLRIQLSEMQARLEGTASDQAAGKAAAI